MSRDKGVQGGEEFEQKRSNRNSASGGFFWAGPPVEPDQGRVGTSLSPSRRPITTHKKKADGTLGNRFDLYRLSEGSKPLRE